MYPLNFRFKCTDEYRDESGSLTFGEINLLDNGLAVMDEVWVPKQAVEGHYSGHELKVSRLEHYLLCHPYRGFSEIHAPSPAIIKGKGQR